MNPPEKAGFLFRINVRNQVPEFNNKMSVKY